MLLLLYSCQTETLKGSLKTNGYLIAPLDSIDEVIPFSNPDYVLGKSSNAIYKIDTNSVSRKILLHDNSFSFDPFDVRPLNDSVVIVIEKENIYDEIQKKIEPSYHFFRIEANLNATLLFDSSRKPAVKEYWFSKNENIGCGLISTRGGEKTRYYQFNEQGILRETIFSLDAEDNIKDVLVNRDSSIWIVIEKSDSGFKYDKFIHKVIFIDKNGASKIFTGFEAANFNEYHLLNHETVLLLDARVLLKLERTATDPSGIFLINRDSNQVKHLFANEEVNNLLVSNEGDYFFVSVKTDKQSPEKVLVLGSDGRTQHTVGTFALTRDFFAGYGLEKDAYSDNIWISTNAGKLYYVYSSQNFRVKTLLTPTGRQKLIPFGKGKALLYIRDAKLPFSWVIADSAKVEALPNVNITNEIENTHFLADKNHYLATDKTNTTYVIDTTGQKLNDGLEFFHLNQTYDAHSNNVLDRIWLTTATGSYLLIHASRIIRNYEVGQNDLFLRLNPSIFGTGISGNNITIDIFDERGRKIGSGNEIVPPSEEIAIPFDLFKKSGPIWNKDLTLKVFFNDFNNSTALVEINSVQFYMPFYKTRQFDTALIFFTLVIITFFLQLARRNFPLLYKYGPSILWMISLLIPFFRDKISSWIGVSIDSGLLFSLLGISILILILLCLLFPFILKSVGDRFPFDVLGNALLKIPSFRKRYFSKYLEDLENSIKDEKSATIDSKEIYVPVPATFVINKQDEMAVRPVDRLISLFTKEKNGIKAAIIAPGGQGKSAMLRQLAFQYLQAFKSNSSLPVPIYFNAAETKIDDFELLLKDHLGEYLKPTEYAAQHRLIRKGAYIIMIDDISEAVGYESFLKQFEKGKKEYAKLSVVITLRPHEKNEKVIASIDRSVIIHPLKITEELIGTFEAAYLPPGEHLPDDLRNICRTNDGFYQPILVRLAILAYKTSVNNITQLYEAAIRNLSGKSDLAAYKDMEAAMAKLCKESYGKDGVREITYRPDNAALIHVMEKAGLLIRTDRENVFGNISKRYRFFHDSIQTYLATIGFFYEQLNPKELFFQFATHPHFIKDQSDFLFENGSEIYQIALLVFDDFGVNVKGILKLLLIEWFTSNKIEYRTRDILNSMPVKGAIQLNEMANEKSLEEVFAYCVDHVSNSLPLIGEFYYRIIQVVPPNL